MKFIQNIKNNLRVGLSLIFGFLATVALADENAQYLIIDLSGGAEAASYPVSTLSSMPAGGWTDEYKSTKLVLRRCPAGADPLGRYTLTKDFYAGVFEVTEKQWELVMGSNPSSYKRGDTYPAEHMSYNDIRGSGDGVNWPSSSAVDATSFLGKLRAKTGLPELDLPTEAQWEYACRAGTTTTYYTGDTEDYLALAGWYIKNSNEQKHPVGEKTANAWELYDMHGNVWEWCLDWHWKGGSLSGTDPVGAASGSIRTNRGGSWYDETEWLDSSGSTYHNVPGDRKPSKGSDDLGFRLFRTVTVDADNVVPAEGWPSWVLGTWTGAVVNVVPQDDGTSEVIKGSYELTLTFTGSHEKYVFDDGEADESDNDNRGWKIVESRDCHVIATCWCWNDEKDDKFDATYVFRDASCRCGDGKSSFKMLLREGDDTVEGTLTKVDVTDPDVPEPLTLETALDEKKLAQITTGGDAEWTPLEDATAKVGESLVKSGAVGMEQSTWLEATVYGKGTLTFWWKVSCEPDPRGRYTYDHITFTADGEDKSRLDGEKGWEQVSVTFTTDGAHTLRWTYSTDDWEKEGYQDCAWVDGVVWTGDAAPVEPAKPSVVGDGGANTTGDATVGDGQPWTPKVTVKGGASGFYSIRVSK